MEISLLVHAPPWAPPLSFPCLYLQVHFWCLLSWQRGGCPVPHHCSLAFCSLLELVVTSLKTDLDWWSGAGGWRKLWGKSFSSKPMRWSWISKNWATFKLIHSWKSIWHRCWWRCWNELTYIAIFSAPPSFFFFKKKGKLLWYPSLHVTGKNTVILTQKMQGVLCHFTKTSLHLWGW